MRPRKDEKMRKRRLVLVLNLLDVGFICRCPFIDESKSSEMDRPLFVLKEKRKNDKKSNHHSENSAHIKSIHWVVFDMSLSLCRSFSSLSRSFALSPSPPLYPSILPHDIQRKKGKLIPIGSTAKKKSQYKVKIPTTPEYFLAKSLSFLLPKRRESKRKIDRQLVSKVILQSESTRNFRVKKKKEARR